MAVFAAFAVSQLVALLAGIGARRPWLLTAAASLGLAGLLALNVANPEAGVVRHNLDAVERTNRFDAGYLGQLSDDAVPALVDGLPSLGE